jgi:glycosyltransferase involved in cell wall biosynthesis
LAAIASFLVRVPIRLHIFAGLPWETMSGVKRKIAMVCDRVIVLLNTKCYSDSNSQAHVLYENRIAKIGTITVLGHGSVTGVDVDRFNFQRYESVKSSLRKLLEIEIDDPVILFVGRITREKGVSELTHAFCEVKKVIKNLHLIVVGPIDLDVDPLDESVIDLMRQSEDIHLIGEDYEPEKYFAASDFLVIPSYREGFCNVVIEAASMGKPAIGTRVTGLVDSIIDGDTGILVDVKSVNALIEAIFLLLRDKEMLKIMGVKARIRAQANFSQSYVNNLVVQEYQRV